ncbi:MAG: D-glycero-beta-D-manno-heptose 1,7-bisphosphate 7-phosphatase [Litorivicinaceae bacterium]|nr:D-glycero-beta-D-manno-heptose 1,7-bisphosphate 7-phosphatase [Litorivicinaceae bacterium]MDP5329818.1 D-glycero-beta-D-manno-heptose 1,7-bisphosphate 7-phosphatase [Litorivicinaceae bacterium]MDP5341405.1 D-glycero-beta-D-manno-heptose 1,7-bisphosphate 7-phosphatase [Litorivicinaceae bacterium]MDP5363539.1 D-glycero-beta-D-manno-heptose 1,7-bisphosphate 7-phosphatase [Litorivicinaceae bacterium]
MAVIVLDRDGVINQDSDDYIKSPSEWVPIPGSLRAMSALHSAGYTLCVATNQSGLARGLFSVETLEAVHHKMHQEVSREGGEITLIAFCPHHPDAHCRCRKPSVGLLEQINAAYPLNSDTDWIVGDSSTDLLAGQRMGIRGALVETGKGQRELQAGRVSRETTPVFKDLFAFTRWLLNKP